MRTNSRYKWMLSGALLDEIIFSQQVNPQYNSLNIKHVKHDDEMYYTSSFDSKLTFVETDFELIYNCDIRTKFELTLIDNSGVFSLKRMTFMRTDCEIDINHETIVVTPILFDKYKKLNEKKDDEYSVVDMGLDKYAVKFRIHPLREYYILGDSNICVFSDSLLPAYTSIKNMPLRWQDMTNVNPVDISDNKDFGFKNMYVCGGVGTGVLSGIWANWDNVFHTVGLNHSMFMTREYLPGAFNTLDYFISLRWMQTTPIEPIYWFIDLFNINDSNTPVSSVQLDEDTDTLIGTRHTVTFSGYGTFTFQIFHVFSRIVTAVQDLVESDTVKAISLEDIYPLQYKNALRENEYFGKADENGTYNLFFCKFSTRISDTDKGYGQIQEGNNAGKYYDTPDDEGIWQPAYKESWFQGASIWFYMRQLYLGTEYYKINDLPDSYKLGDVIKGMLAKIDSSIIFEPDTEHSLFLFSQINPVTQLPQNQKYITQKSNFLKYEYDYAAWKAPLKWSQLDELLKNAFNCYTELFYKDSDNSWHLRIEHVSYFLKGHTYDSSGFTQNALDLNNLYDGFNRKKLSFKTNRWKYDTSSQASRYEFGWMDTQSDAFDGSPLVVAEEYKLYEDEHKVDCKVSWFSSDIDFMQMAIEECSNDGFVILSVLQNGYVEFQRVNSTRYAQNFSLAFDYLVPAFHIYNKYAAIVFYEGTNEQYAVSIRKKMRIANDIMFKVPANYELQPTQHIITEVGIGEIEELTVDMTDNSCITTLRYNML